MPLDTPEPLKSSQHYLLKDREAAFAKEVQSRIHQLPARTSSRAELYLLPHTISVERSNGHASGGAIQHLSLNRSAGLMGRSRGDTYCHGVCVMATDSQPAQFSRCSSTARSLVVSNISSRSVRRLFGRRGLDGERERFVSPPKS
ncbi:Uncharacterized protein HZ326_28771 [Fusarium oxysporum f. sp. albedinis]|nr:Uncharacterized protein HZ326_28771 [Fusarium oxysporum f. sp. albedinis]